MIARPSRYRGRFAPTPSGPLHLGSLLTAVASWLAARQAGGDWLLRIDDLDRPRCAAGAEATILRQLEAHGLTWDGPLLRQSEHVDRYRDGLASLQREGRLFACVCTRAGLQRDSLEGPDGPVYAGTCRTRGESSSEPAALRFRVSDGDIAWQDGLQGPLRRSLRTDCGDFVVRRSDGQIGYHLACALDEHHLGITEVLRGADLIGATAQQRLLSQALGLPLPAHAHLPVLLAEDGRKLSKQNGAAALALDASSVPDQLRRCLAALRLPAPERSLHEPGPLLEWATQHWRPDLLCGVRALPASAAALP